MSFSRFHIRNKIRREKVSIIIPTYNRREFVCEAIESVLNQTFQDWQLFVIDDGSTDNTEEKLKQYNKKITYIKNNHAGVSVARNCGIQISSGDYIAFLDSDDLWHNAKLEKQIDYFRLNPEASICQTEEIWIRNGKWVNPKKVHRKPSGWIFNPSLSLCLITPSSVMIHRKVFDQIGCFNENLPACEDYDLWLRLTLHYPVHLIRTKLITKRGGHSDQLSRTIWGLDQYRIQAMENLIKNEILTADQLENVKNILIKKINIFSEGCLKRGKFDEYEVYQKKLEKLSVN